MRAPKLTTRTKSLATNTRVKGPRNKVATSNPNSGARKVSRKDAAEDGEFASYRNLAKDFRVSFGDTGLQADDFE